jgi:hypothetical protein
LILSATLLVSLATAISVVPARVSRVSDSAPADVLEFVEGIVWGMEVSFAKNATECVDEETTVLADFSAAYADIKKGLEHLSPSEVERGIHELGVGVISLRQIFFDCGLNSTLADLDHISQLLQGGVVGWVEAIASEVLNILEHRVTIGSIIRNAVRAYDQKPPAWKVVFCFFPQSDEMCWHAASIGSSGRRPGRRALSCGHAACSTSASANMPTTREPTCYGSFHSRRRLPLTRSISDCGTWLPTARSISLIIGLLLRSSSMTVGNTLCSVYRRFVTSSWNMVIDPRSASRSASLWQ